MSETQATINQWISDTFGEAGSNISVAARANQEMAELIMKLAINDSDSEAIEEVADVVIVLYRLVHRFDASLSEQIDRKMMINRDRRWNVANGHGYHVKASVEAVNSHEALVAENKRLREYYDAVVDMALTGLLNATHAQVMRLRDARAAVHEYDTRSALSAPSQEGRTDG